MTRLRVLHLEDDPGDALLVRRALAHGGLDVDLVHTSSPAAFIDVIDRGGLDAVLVDSGVPGFSERHALAAVRDRQPGVPVIFVSGSLEAPDLTGVSGAESVAFVPKSELGRLVTVLREARASTAAHAARAEADRGAMRLVAAVQELSLARDVETIRATVRRTAREMTGADGATFILRDGDRCHYVDEDAIGPLWKGQKFPMSACISGWVMLHREAAAIEDIYADPRIPADAYRPTFVKSLVMVPIRTADPVGAIGTYWATPHQATSAEVTLLQALANTTAVAMENVRVYAELEERVRERTVQLQAANRELEAFSFSVSHDLRAPIRRISGYAEWLAERLQGRDEAAEADIARIRSQAEQMTGLIEDLLRLARYARVDLRRTSVDVSAMAHTIVGRLRAQSPDRTAEIRIADGLTAFADEDLLRIALDNLLSNAWKYTAKRPHTVIEMDQTSVDAWAGAFFVRDNGAGFDMAHAARLFGPFQRLHSQDDFAGTGVGLATVQRIVHRHGGRIWAEAVPGEGATFFFTIPPVATLPES